MATRPRKEGASMRYKLLPCAMVALAVPVGTAYAGGGGDGGHGHTGHPGHHSSDKVVICHAGKAFTIKVARDAVRVHLAHGDSLGPCRRPKPTPTPSPTATPPP